MRTRRANPEAWVSLALLLAIAVVLLVLVSCQMPLRNY